MKKLYYSRVFILLGMLILWMGGCEDVCHQTFTYTVYEPVYMTHEELKAAVQTQEPKALRHPGKIYLKDNYLFINEVGKGIHVFNNANPSSPQAATFINIPGNVDLAVMGDILYADNATDLVAIDISDPAHVQIVKQIENVFPASVQYPGTARGFDPATLVQPDPSRGVIVDWIKREEKRVSGCDQPSDYQTGWISWRGGFAFADMAKFSSSAPTSLPIPSAGIGGSMARFTISRNYLYTVDNSSLRLYNIIKPEDPQPANPVNVGWGIETIFPYKDKLFIGSQTGMFIYDISNPAQPAQVSAFNHLQSCDPVVVDDKYAYITLRSGTTCRNTTLNQLDVVDISNLQSPRLVKSYSMQNPHGLGKDGNLLFVCDGKAGLKVYNAADVLNIDKNQLASQSMHSYDVIPYRNLAIVTGEDGLYQYDYSDPQNLKLLSKIQVVKE